VKIEISQIGTGILNIFAKSIDSQVENDRVSISRPFGHGYVKAIQLNENLRMIIRNYELFDDVIVKAQPGGTHSDMLIFNFQNVIRETAVRRPFELPYVQITTQGINKELYIPSYTKHRSIIIAARPDYIRELIGSKTSSTLLRSIMKNEQSLIFEHLISSSLQKVIQEITTTSVSEDFSNLFYRVKVEELLCFLLIELVQREETPIHAINVNDIKAIYEMKERLISNLSTPPVIPLLSKSAGMSESKLRKLFKQVFGINIFAYYQTCRMQLAARLLREEKLSVTEAGYKIGFTNMSHFSKTFEAHMGVKPKKYTML
jgi:AraC-like DNA-binding protein